MRRLTTAVAIVLLTSWAAAAALFAVLWWVFPPTIERDLGDGWRMLIAVCGGFGLGVALAVAWMRQDRRRQRGDT